MTETVAATRSESATSSVRIATSTRGVDVEVKVYCARPEQPVSEAGDAAYDEFVRITEKIRVGLMGQKT